MLVLILRFASLRAGLRQSGEDFFQLPYPALTHPTEPKSGSLGPGRAGLNNSVPAGLVFSGDQTLMSPPGYATQDGTKR